AETKTVTPNSSEEELVVQYVVVRRDLIDTWPLGSVVTLEVKGEIPIVNLSEKLKSNGILHKLWTEQPENIPTCLATKAYPKSMVSPFFRKLKLCK
ncbi:putative peptidyl-tRNA hydrolase PTRHD1, partial [Bienertia sinuspersici]